MGSSFVPPRHVRLTDAFFGLYLIIKGFKTPNLNTPEQTAGPVQS